MKCKGCGRKFDNKSVKFNGVDSGLSRGKTILYYTCLNVNCCSTFVHIINNGSVEIPKEKAIEILKSVLSIDKFAA